MTDLHALRDPDPLNPSDVDHAYAEGFADGWTSTKPRSLSAPLVLGLIAGAFLAGFIVHAALAASRPAPVIPAVRVETAGREPDRGRTEAPRTASAGSRTGASPSPGIRATPTPRPKPPKVTAGTVRGVATWYCGNGSRCTVGHPGGYFAAIRSDLLSHRGDQVRVCSASRCVVVTIIDCNCGPGANLVDLYADAFDDLAPLSRGRIAVTLEWLL